jgi:hypothetical protein
MKVFVLGWNKSGTKSLTKALEILGYNVLDTAGGGKTVEVIKDNILNQKPIMTNLEQYDCYVDFPFFEPLVFSHLVNENKNAKYISLTRNLDDYVDSVLKHKIRNIENGVEPSWHWLGTGDKNTFLNFPQELKDWIKRKTWFNHLSNLNWLKKHNIDYLELDITKGDKWEKLCKYLDKEIPTQEFPYLNKG